MLFDLFAPLDVNIVVHGVQYEVEAPFGRIEVQAVLLVAVSEEHLALRPFGDHMPDNARFHFGLSNVTTQAMKVFFKNSSELNHVLNIQRIKTARGQVIAYHHRQLLTLKQHEGHGTALDRDVWIIWQGFDFFIFGKVN